MGCSSRLLKLSMQTHIFNCHLLHCKLNASKPSTIASPGYNPRQCSIIYGGLQLQLLTKSTKTLQLYDSPTNNKKLKQTVCQVPNSVIAAHHRQYIFIFSSIHFLLIVINGLHCNKFKLTLTVHYIIIITFKQIQ